VSNTTLRTQQEVLSASRPSSSRSSSGTHPVNRCTRQSLHCTRPSCPSLYSYPVALARCAVQPLPAATTRRPLRIHPPLSSVVPRSVPLSQALVPSSDRRAYSSWTRLPGSDCIIDAFRLPCANCCCVSVLPVACRIERAVIRHLLHSTIAQESEAAESLGTHNSPGRLSAGRHHSRPARHAVMRPLPSACCEELPQAPPCQART
jgi:hypothetical protein